MPVNNNLLHQIFARQKLRIQSITAVAEGDINTCFKVSTTNASYFIKLNDASNYPGMLQREAEGLITLQQRSSLVVPTTVACDVIENQQYLVLTYLNKGAIGIDFFTNFGEGLAIMHKNTNTAFGWHTSNYIGLLQQPNTWHQNWCTFYSTQRIMPLVNQLHQQKNYNTADVINAKKVCAKLGEIFPAEVPAMLHGDLWSGNYMPVQLNSESAATSAAIYDPAVYYGNREMDIGMSKLFGGFDSLFYKAYHHHYPLQPQWQQRLPLTQWYPLLVHALLFGGYYIKQSRATIKAFL